MRQGNEFNHRDYYVSRARASRMLAEGARDPDVAAIHYEFATRYDLLAETVSFGRSDGGIGDAPAA